MREEEGGGRKSRRARGQVRRAGEKGALEGK